MTLLPDVLLLTKLSQQLESVWGPLRDSKPIDDVVPLRNRLEAARTIMVRQRHRIEALQMRLLHREELEAAYELAAPQAFRHEMKGSAEGKRWRRLTSQRTPFAVHLLLFLGYGFSGRPELDALRDLVELVQGACKALRKELKADAAAHAFRLSPGRLRAVVDAFLDPKWEPRLAKILASHLDSPRTVDELRAVAPCSERTLYRALKVMDEAGLREVAFGFSPKVWRLTRRGRDAAILATAAGPR